MDGEWVEIAVSDEDYNKAVEKAKKFLGKDASEEEIEEFVNDCFEREFDMMNAKLQEEYEEQQEYYRELNRWLDRQQGV